MTMSMIKDICIMRIKGLYLLAKKKSFSGIFFNRKMMNTFGDYF